MESPIYFEYDKITDDVYWLSNTMVLRLNVPLSRKGKDGNRRHYHSEFRYDKYFGKASTIRRSFDPYLSLEHLENRSEIIQIKYPNMLALQFALKQVTKWFADSFGEKNGKLVILKHHQLPVEAAYDHKILFEPVIITYDDMGTHGPGVRLTFVNSPSLYADIDVNRFYGFVYLINSIDLYQCAITLLNYMSSPMIGQNVMEFERSYVEQKEDSIVANAERQSPALDKKKKSFFSDIDDITS